MKVVKSLGIYFTNYSVRLSVCLLCHAVFSSKLWLFSVAALKSMFLISKNISMNNVNIIIYTLTHFFLLASLFICFATYGCRYHCYEYVKINLSLIPCLYPTTLPISLFLSLFSFLSVPFIFNYPLNFFWSILWRILFCKKLEIHFTFSFFFCIHFFQFLCCYYINKDNYVQINRHV